MTTERGAVAGRVVDVTGAPVPDAAVAISSGPGPQSDIAALTDAAGRFRLGNLTPGRYTLAVHANGLASGEVSADVTAGVQAQVSVSLEEEPPR